jgi:hypothetical protein
MERDLPEKLTLIWLKNLPSSIVFESLLLFPQEPAIKSCPELEESNSQNSFLMIPAVA